MNVTIETWARLPGPAKVLAEARQLLENRRDGARVTVAVTLSPLERVQIARLLGLKWDASGRPVTLGKLRDRLTDAGDDLTDLLVRLGGDLDDLPAKAAQEAATAKSVVDAAYQQLTDAQVPAHAVDLARDRHWLDRAGLPIAGRATALTRLWAALPAPGRPLPELANQLFDDPHALDRDADLGRVAARLLAAITTVDNPAGAADSALIAAHWRTVWAGQGVQCDEVSSTVLILNLRMTGTSAAAALCDTAARHGEPVWLTARSLRGDWRPDDATVIVRVCENPAIMEAAANRHGPDALPLVCIYGRPSSAAWMLLRGLAAAGTRLFVTADRDKAGKQFLTELLTLATAEEWLPDAGGFYEEARLEALLDDLQPDPAILPSSNRSSSPHPRG